MKPREHFSLLCFDGWLLPSLPGWCPPVSPLSLHEYVPTSPCSFCSLCLPQRCTKWQTSFSPCWLSTIRWLKAVMRMVGGRMHQELRHLYWFYFFFFEKTLQFYDIFFRVVRRGRRNNWLIVVTTMLKFSLMLFFFIIVIYWNKLLFCFIGIWDTTIGFFCLDWGPSVAMECMLLCLVCE